MSIRFASFCIILAATANHSLAGEPVPLADEVMLTSGKSVQVRPLREPFDLKKVTGEELVFVAATRPDKVVFLRRDEIVGVRYFEQIALARSDTLLKEGEEASRLLTAETLLQTTLQTHLGERLHVPLADNPWQPLQRTLADRIEEVRCRYLKAEMSKDALLAAIERWSPGYAGPGTFRNTVHDVWVRLGLDAVRKEAFKDAAYYLRRLEVEFSMAPQTEELRTAVRNRAVTFLKEAEGQSGEQVLASLKQVNELFPRLPGLQDVLARKKGTFRTLYVAVRSLPEMMSPATASTDTERQVLDLIFEPLVRPRAEARRGLDYEPVLTTTLPVVKESHQSIELREAWWTESEPVSAADVRHTIRLNLGVKLGGRDSYLRELFAPVRWEGEPRHIALEPRQGLFDPLEPLSFFVLPQQFRGKALTKADDAEFAQKPLGSGPYHYQGRVQENQQTYAVFTANPAYGQRHRGQVREIRLFVPGKTLSPPLPHVIIDMPGLAKQGYQEVQQPAWRRVYFVAVNHRRPELANVKLRRFLALAVDRDKILQDFFPGDKSQSLNGPYPLESWATCPPPRVPRSLYQPELARSLARELKAESAKIRLTLKYPSDDPRVEKACQALIAGWEQTAQAVGLNLHVEPHPLAPRELKNALDHREYDLVYQRHDFSSAAFTLWPLFDVHPSALEPGGSNYLGYENDARLLRLAQTALKHRQFETLQELTHDMHAHLNERMPLVPLWQLPVSIAVLPGVELGDVDPLRLFAHVQGWRLPASK